MLDLQMPTFIRGDEDEDAEELFYLPPQPTPSCMTDPSLQWIACTIST